MHMLRKVEYGTWGKSFTKTSDNIKYQDTITIPLEIQINSEWKPKNCHLAVYLSTDEPAKTKDNYRIIQAVEASIIKNDDTTEK